MTCPDIELTITETGDDINLTVTEQPEDMVFSITENVFGTTFINLGDTPANYTGKANNYVRVNATEDGVEFIGESSAVDWGEIGGTLSNQTDLQAELDLLVPYSGATSDVNLGVYNLVTTGNVNVNSLHIKEQTAEQSGEDYTLTNTQGSIWQRIRLIDGPSGAGKIGFDFSNDGGSNWDRLLSVEQGGNLEFEGGVSDTRTLKFNEGRGYVRYDGATNSFNIASGSGKPIKIMPEENLFMQFNSTALGDDIDIYRDVNLQDNDLTTTGEIQGSVVGSPAGLVHVGTQDSLGEGMVLSKDSSANYIDNYFNNLSIRTWRSSDAIYLRPNDTDVFSVFDTKVNLKVPLDMNTNQINELAVGVLGNDAINKGQMDTADALLVPYIGATSDIDLNNKSITNIHDLSLNIGGKIIVGSPAANNIGIAMDSSAFFIFSDTLTGLSPNATNILNNFNNYDALLARRNGTGTGNFFVAQDNLGNTKFRITSDGGIDNVGANFEMNNKKITDLATPTDLTDATNKNYVDTIVNAAIRLQGDWDADTNTPDITGTTTTGAAWRVSVAGSTNLGGITDWAVGDLAVKTETSWLKIANQDVAAVWGNISGTLSNQTDLQNALDFKWYNDGTSTATGDWDLGSYDITATEFGFTGGQTLSWNATEYTVDIPTGLGPVLQAGQEVFTIVYNLTGSTITDGQVVHPVGAVGGRPAVVLAQADTWENFTGALFVATMDIPAASEGIATAAGDVRDINTTGLSLGDVYLSAATAGALTSTPPSFPNYKLLVGGVVTVDAINGQIKVQPAGVKEDTTVNFWNGVFREPFDFRVSSNGTVITGSLEPTNGHENMTMIFSDGFTTLDTAPAKTITLTAGTDTNPQTVYVYIPQSTKVLTESLTGFPTAEHIPVAKLLLRSATATQTDDAFKNQNINNELQDTNTNQGHLTHIGDRIRVMDAEWDTGAASTLSGVPTNVYISNTSGTVYQMHKQTFPAQDMSTGDHIHIVNDSVTAFRESTNLNDLTLDSEGNTLNNKWYSLVVWGVCNKSGETSHLMCNLPSGSYNSEANAVSDALGYSNYIIPKDFKGVGFLIGRYTVKKSGTTFTYNSTIGYQDLRGFVPNSTAGSGAGSSGITTFLGLTDTPSSYASQAGKVPVVNSGETALEFSTINVADLVPYTGATADVDLGVYDLTATNLTGEVQTASQPQIDHDSLLNYAANRHIDWTNATNNFATTGTITLNSETVIHNSNFTYTPATSANFAFRNNYSVGKGFDFQFNSGAGYTTVLTVDGSGISCNNFKIINLTDPLNPQDAATKNYVDTEALWESSTGSPYNYLTPATTGYGMYTSGYLAVGALPADASTVVNIDKAISTSGTFHGIFLRNVFTPSVANQWFYGLRLNTVANITQHSSKVIGFDGRMEISGAPALTVTLAEYTSIRAGLKHVNTKLTTTTAHRIYAEQWDEGVGTITNLYGVKIDDVDDGVNNWALHTGTGLHSFGDTMELRVNDKYFKQGASLNVGMKYDGTDWIFDSQLVGTGDFKFTNGAVQGLGGFKSSDGSAGLSSTYNFGGGSTGDIATMTFKNGLLTAVTTVP